MTLESDWFDKKLMEAKTQPLFWMETHISRFDEAYLKFKTPKGLDLVFYRVCMWCAYKLIDRCFRGKP